MNMDLQFNVLQKLEKIIEVLKECEFSPCKTLFSLLTY